MSNLQEVPEKLPCGCKLANRVVEGEKQFLIEPCSPDCEYYLFVVAEAKRQRVETQVREGTFGVDGRIEEC